VPQLESSSPVRELLDLWDSPRPQQYERLKEQFL
jgi:hypothetical protein